MNLSELKSILKTVEAVNFVLPDGTTVPEHFHVTEVGLINKDFIDCGGTIRNEKAISLQLWSADDVDHRLKPQKLMSIIEISERALPIHNYEIEVEYQAETIGKFGLDFNGKDFLLTTKQTACLAQDHCGIPVDKQKKSLADIGTAAENSCTPGGGCC